METDMKIAASNSLNSEPLLAIFVTSKNQHDVLSSEIFQKSFSKWVEDSSFEGKAGQIQFFPGMALLDQGDTVHVAVVGLGDSTEDDLCQAAGKVGYECKARSITGVTFYNPISIQKTILHSIIGNYRFDKYKTKKKDSLQSIVVFGDGSEEDFQTGKSIAQARNFARDLVNAPAADLYPETLADEAQTLAGDNITVEIWGEERLMEENMVGIIAVGQGSINPARFIHLHYKPTGGSDKKVALVGKGVTFDAGGLSLKPSSGMLTMRCDMGGSAVVLGVFKAIKLLQPDIEVHGIVGAVENMCAANSYKLGDILTYNNGTTVEIHNTDAEGRLVLADCLTYASKLGVDYMVDFATLTGACVVALGNYYSGIFSNEEELVEGLLSAANDCQEGLWRMPLTELYKPMLKAEWGDIKNVGGRSAGSITAALFLSEFVSDTKWAHVDIAGPAFLDKPFRHFASGGTGAMVESVFHWLQQLK
jgi:leucyl aminopeptidase